MTVLLRLLTTSGENSLSIAPLEISFSDVLNTVHSELMCLSLSVGQRMATPSKTPPGADPKQLERTGTVREIGSQAVWSLSSCKPGQTQVSSPVWCFYTRRVCHFNFFYSSNGLQVSEWIS